MGTQTDHDAVSLGMALEPLNHTKQCNSTGQEQLPHRLLVYPLHALLGRAVYARSNNYLIATSARKYIIYLYGLAGICDIASQYQ
ncbi:hypothetical protein [Pseudomonas sp.]|uniref:hypothetical protein n=1 Tax=Pseudomonas sp. TaxID=306 RepID=UPI00289D8472|nr:hypothetical protein [Pseudomonas sp.]